MIEKRDTNRDLYAQDVLIMTYRILSDLQDEGDWRLTWIEKQKSNETQLPNQHYLASWISMEASFDPVSKICGEK